MSLLSHFIKPVEGYYVSFRKCAWSRFVLVVVVLHKDRGWKGFFFKSSLDYCMNISMKNRRGFIKDVVLVSMSSYFGRAGFLMSMDNKKKFLVGCRDALLQAVNSDEIWQSIRMVSAEGLEVEIDRELNCPNLKLSGKALNLSSAAGRKLFADEFRRHGIRAFAFLTRTRVAVDSEVEIEYPIKVARVASELEIPAIRIDLAQVQRGDVEEFFRDCVKFCQKVCKGIKGLKVKLGVENHGMYTNDVDFLEKLFDAVGDDNLGLTLDTANFYWFGYPLNDLYSIYKKFSNRIVHTHCKNIAYPQEKRNVKRSIGWEYSKYSCAVDCGDINFVKVIQILASANYSGALCLEDESIGKVGLPDRISTIKREIDYLRMVQSEG